MPSYIPYRDGRLGRAAHKIMDARCLARGHRAAPSNARQPPAELPDLAAALAPIAPDVPATVQMLRHWTKVGLLPPAQQQHAGPGKHRAYTLDAIYDAAILYQFNDMGLPISGSSTLTEALDRARSEIANRRAGKGKAKPHLIIAKTAAGTTTVGVYSEGEKIVDLRGFKAADTVVTIDIDLEKLFRKVEGQT